MTWMEFLALVASAGLLSAAFSAGISATGALIKQRRHARYLALRIAIEMDNYFQACFDRISDINDYNASGGHAGAQHFAVPFPSELAADDVGWVNLNPKLSDRVLSFGTRVKYLNSSIRNDLEHMSGPLEDRDMSLTLAHLYEAAQDAYLLARELRHRYDFEQLAHSGQSYEWLVEAKMRHQGRS